MMCAEWWTMALGGLASIEGIHEGVQCAWDIASFKARGPLGVMSGERASVDAGG